MKRIVSVILCFLMLLPVCSLFVSSASEIKTEYLDDGSFIESGFFEVREEASAVGILAKLMEFFRKLMEFFTGNKTVSRTKYVNYYSSEGELLWAAFLDAEFRYNKNEAVCTDAHFRCEIYDSDWKLNSSDINKNENKATVNFSVKQYKLAVPLKTIERELSLTCDTKGNVY